MKETDRKAQREERRQKLQPATTFVNVAKKILLGYFIV